MKYILPFIVFFIGSISVMAQGFYNRGALVSIAPQTTFVLPDSMINTGTLINDGELIISGAWVNTGTYDAGTGQINFNNDQTQTINHSDQSMGKLLITGGGNKQFLADITILSELQLQDGILVSGNGAKIILKQGASIVGGGDQSHIQGPVEHQGTGNWLFPIGNGSLYLPVEIINVTDPTSAATLTLNEGAAGWDPAPAFTKFSENRYWELTSSGATLNESKITLPVRNEETLADETSNLAIVAAHNINGPYSNLGQSAFSGTRTNGVLTSEQPPVFRFFTLGAVVSDRTIEVFNAISANGDEKNAFMRISNIEFYPDNMVTIFNRWGDKVFELRGYNNDKNNFRGESNITGKTLPAGTYFYVIDLKDGSSRKTGYTAVR